MNNKIKKTQTILFASLIVAMILPFSGMNYAQAEVNDTKELKQLDKQINELIAKQHKTQKDNHDLKQLKLLEKWFIAKENNNTDKMRSISAEITKDFPAENLTPAVSSDKLGFRTTGYIPPFEYTGSTEKHWDCLNNDEYTGNIDGTITGYSNAIYGVVNLHYPFDIRDGPAGINCVVVDFDNAEASFIEVLNPDANCRISTFTSATDSEGAYCTELSVGSWLRVQGNVWYDDGNEIFSPWTSHTYEYVG